MRLELLRAELTSPRPRSPSANHMHQSMLGNRRPPPWPSFKDNPGHYALGKTAAGKKTEKNLWRRTDFTRLIEY